MKWVCGDLYLSIYLVTGAARCLEGRSCTSGAHLCSPTVLLFKTCPSFAHCQMMWTACWSKMLLSFFELFLFLIWTTMFFLCFCGLWKAIFLLIWPLWGIPISIYFAKLTACQIMRGVQIIILWYNPTILKFHHCRWYFTKQFKKKHINFFSFFCAYININICHRSLDHITHFNLAFWKCLGNILFWAWSHPETCRHRRENTLFKVFQSRSVVHEDRTASAAAFC